MASIILADNLEIPLGIGSLPEFREWTRSAQFPQDGRIDFVDGHIEVEMTPENVFYHGSPKSEIHYAITHRVKELHAGHVFVDSTRLVAPHANLSAEPDILFVSHATFAAGRARLHPTAAGDPDSFVELEGGVDLIVEVVSDGSVNKDRDRLPRAYFAAGVAEYWLVDARGDQVLLTIHRCGESRFEPVAIDGNGYQASAVLKCRFVLERHRGPGGYWQYDLKSAAN